MQMKVKLHVYTQDIHKLHVYIIRESIGCDILYYVYIIRESIGCDILYYVYIIRDSIGCDILYY